MLKEWPMKLPDNDEMILDYIAAARAGSYSALETVIKLYRDYIYNIVLKFRGKSFDVEDAVQEVFIKLITNLSSFRGESLFRTWVYRITVNHMLNMKRSKHEEMFASFDDHREFIENLPDNSSPAGLSVYSEEKQSLLEEETKVQCQTGMLLCLERDNRIAFILGGIMGIDSATGAEVLGISAATFRKRLSRSRKNLLNYMNNNCSLINPEGACTCRKKTEDLVRQGYVNPENRRFYKEHLDKVKAHVRNYSEHADRILERRVDNSFREHPWLKAPDSVLPLKELVESMKSTWSEHEL